MIELLNDIPFIKDIAQSEDSIIRLLNQVQRDITTPENRDLVGPTILACKHLQDIVLTIAAKGKAHVQLEKQHA